MAGKARRATIGDRYRPGGARSGGPRRLGSGGGPRNSRGRMGDPRGAGSLISNVIVARIAGASRSQDTVLGIAQTVGIEGFSSIRQGLVGSAQQEEEAIEPSSGQQDIRFRHASAHPLPQSPRRRANPNASVRIKRLKSARSFRMFPMPTPEATAIGMPKFRSSRASRKGLRGVLK